ncbi:hypothetical protein FBULB1_9902 [Fusarium bulbicola]|nr:hypothetical protein FBULB1_9902 [Fusarium bulbicola]
MGEYTIPSTDESQSTPDQITDDFDRTRESHELIERGKATWNGLVPAHFHNRSARKIKPFQLAQITNSQPDVVGNAGRLAGDPHERRIHLRTKGEDDKTARSSKRHRILTLQDTQSEPDKLCSTDPAEATVPHIDNDSEASTEF